MFLRYHLILTKMCFKGKGMTLDSHMSPWTLWPLDLAVGKGMCVCKEGLSIPLQIWPLLTLPLGTPSRGSEGIGEAQHLHSRCSVAESSHQQNEDIMFIDHCPSPLFFCSFLSARHSAILIIPVQTCIYSRNCTYFFHKINHYNLGCMHWCSVHVNKDPPHVPKHSEQAWSGMVVIGLGYEMVC